MLKATTITFRIEANKSRKRRGVKYKWWSLQHCLGWNILQFKIIWWCLNQFASQYCPLLACTCGKYAIALNLCNNCAIGALWIIWAENKVASTKIGHTIWFLLLVWALVVNETIWYYVHSANNFLYFSVLAVWTWKHHFQFVCSSRWNPSKLPWRLFEDLAKDWKLGLFRVT